MNLTEKFKKGYIPGYDCRLSTFRNSLAVNNLVLTNSMMLGLAGSLIFCFNDGKIYSRLPLFILAGINDQSLEGLAFNLNIYLLRGRMYDMNEAKTQIPKYLSMGIPVNIAINREALQEQLGSLTGQINMGHHYVTITDFDEEKNIFTLFETDTAQKLSLTGEQLEEIWFYDLLKKRDGIDPFQMCDGQWYGFFTNEQIKQNDLIAAAYRAINKVLMNFFKSPIKFIYGKDALLHFQQTVHTWKGDSSINNVLHDSIFVMKAMESGMSGGGFGRKLYGFFLKELSSMTNDQDLREISADFTELGRLWKDFVTTMACLLDDKNDVSEIFMALENKIDTLVLFETRSMEKLNIWFTNKQISQ